MTDREYITDRAHGIDVSHWQETYIYAKTWGQVDFAIAKIGEGYNTPYSSTNLGDWTDFNKIWIGGCDQVAIRGVYFYQRSGYSWEQQATEVLEAVAKMAIKPHMIWCDIEKGNNVVDKTMLADSLRIMDYWKANSPYLIGSYANKDIWQAYIHDIGLRYYGQEWVDRFVAYPKFYAQYWNVPDPNKEPSLAACLNGAWDVWQYTDKGDSDEYRDGTRWRHYGSPDLDVFNGTVAEMRAWLRITDEPPPDDIPPTGDKMILTSLTNGLRIRIGPAITYPQVTVAPTYLNNGQTAEVISLNGTAGSEQWAQIGIDRWSNVWRNGYQNAILSGELPLPVGAPVFDAVLTEADGTVYDFHAEGAKR